MVNDVISITENTQTKHTSYGDTFMRLTIELVPTTCWYSNVRSNVFPDTWDRLQRTTFAAAYFRCEVCGGRGSNHPVDCHEVWHYDDHKLIQRLERLEALCPKCHQVKHIGLAVTEGRSKEVIAWLAHINGITPAQALSYVHYVMSIHKIRSQFQWELDLQILSSQFSILLDKTGIEQGLNARAQFR